MVLSTGAFDDNYYLLPLLNGWTNAWADRGPNKPGVSIGTANGNKTASNYALCGPDFHEELPSSLMRIDLATNMVWMLGRIQCQADTDNLDAYEKAWDLQDTLKLTPLSKWGRADEYIPPAGKINDDLPDLPPPEQVKAKTEGDCSEFFEHFCSLMKANPADPADSHMDSILNELGLTPDARIQWKSSMSMEDFKFAQAAAERALESIVSPSKGVLENIGALDTRAASPNNNWVMLTGPFMANYEHHYHLRAFIASKGLGANLAPDAIYPSCHLDSNGDPLRSSDTYTLTFEAGMLPPCSGFWSITAYNKDGYLIANALERYTLYQHDFTDIPVDNPLVITLCPVGDGFDQTRRDVLPLGNINDEPGAVSLTIRIYWPDLDRINSETKPWRPPAIIKVTPTLP